MRIFKTRVKGTVLKLLNFVLNFSFKVIEEGGWWSHFRETRMHRQPRAPWRPGPGQPAVGLLFILFTEREDSQFPDENWRSLANPSFAVHSWEISFIRHRWSSNLVRQDQATPRIHRLSGNDGQSFIFFSEGRIPAATKMDFRCETPVRTCCFPRVTLVRHTVKSVSGREMAWLSSCRPRFYYRPSDSPGLLLDFPSVVLTRKWVSLYSFFPFFSLSVMRRAFQRERLDSILCLSFSKERCHEGLGL